MGWHDDKVAWLCNWLELQLDADAERGWQNGSGDRDFSIAQLFLDISQNITMKRTFRWLFVLLLLVATAHRLPAPIQEIPESPTPHPSIAQTPTPKKSTAKPKPTSPASQAAKSATTPQANFKISRYAGKWVGTMPEAPWGNVATELMVDQSETTMEWQESGRRKGVAQAHLSGETLTASFPAGFTVATWSLVVQPDGSTARVRLQAFMNDQTAIFRRVAGGSRAR